MKIAEDEKKLLFAVKIIPLVIFFCLAVIVTLLALYIHKTNYNNEIEKVKSEYFKNEKEILKQEVIKIHNNIQNEKELTEEHLKSNIKSKVNEAYAVMNNIYRQNKTKSKEEILKLIKDALRDIRFNDNRGYYFMYKMDGTNLLLPTLPDLEGENFIKFKDAKGVETIREMRDLTRKKGESFYTWWWYKPHQKEYQSKKIGYAKYFKPLDSFIGTGEYVEDFEETIKKSITKRLSSYRHGKNLYVFIFDKEGTVLTHIDKNRIGTNNLKDKNSNDIYATYDIVNIDDNQGKFLSYTIKNDGEHAETQKISYVKKFKEWEWIIGSGFYTNDLKTMIEERKAELSKENKYQIKMIISIAVVIGILVTLMSLFLSYIIENRFKKYKEKAEQKDKLMFQQSKMAAMGEMLENIAHQWRQPLSVITTGVSGIKMQKEFSLLTDEKLDSSLDNILVSADHLSQTVDDFRNFYKNDNEKSTFMIESVINKAIQLMQSKFENKDIKIIKNISNAEVFGFKNELVQVVINILNNSRDVLSSVGEEQKVIVISVEKVRENVVITFCDNGCGIAEENLLELFDQKFTTKEESGGTGIGLYMSKLIVEKIGGKIEVKNKQFSYNDKECIGAEFTIILPLSR